MLTPKQIEVLRESPLAPNRVKVAMRLAGLTQVEVAAKLGITQSHVSEIANGNYSSLPLDTARKFATFFGCLIEDLFPSREAVAS